MTTAGAIAVPEIDDRRELDDALLAIETSTNLGKANALAAVELVEAMEARIIPFAVRVMLALGLGKSALQQRELAEKAHRHRKAKRPLPATVVIKRMPLEPKPAAPALTDGETPSLAGAVSAGEAAVSPEAAASSEVTGAVDAPREIATEVLPAAPAPEPMTEQKRLEAALLRALQRQREVAGG